MANVDFGRYKRIVQYFWDPEPKNDDPSLLPIWCLGKEYTVKARYLENQQPPESELWANKIQPNDRKPAEGDPHPINCDLDSGVTLSPRAGEEDRGWPGGFLDDFESRFWFTYRSHFPPIQRSTKSSASSPVSLSVRLRSQLVDQGGFTSDTGWGCMIRSGQCLLANALGILKLGRDWRRGRCQQEERDLLALFSDDPKAPYSLHKFVEHGASACGKYPGEWFGPSATARCIEALSKEHTFCGLKVYVTGDGADVYENTFLKLAKGDGEEFNPVLVLVGIRLGIDGITPVYWDALQDSLKLPQSIGIAGGRPSSSHYFVGAQGENVFYLDPHQVRQALPWHQNTSNYTTEDIDSCHTRRLRRLHIKDMDPSMLIAFLIRDIGDWHSWRQGVNQTEGKPVVHVADIEPLSHQHNVAREAALDEVQTLDDESENDFHEEDGELVNLPATS